MVGTVIKRPGRVQEITAVSNPRIKAIRGLTQKKNRDQTGAFVVEGMKLVRDAFENGWEISTLVYGAKLKQENSGIEHLAAQVRAKGGDILEVNEKVLSSITRKDNPQMVISVLHQQWVEPPEVIHDPTSVWIALDRIRDPGNLGTIMRTADAASAEGIILVGDATDPYSFEATRASMGSIFNVQLVKQTESEFLTWRKSWSGLVIGTHLEGSKDYRLIEYHSKPILLLMGNEQQGLTDELTGACDQLVRIPMVGSADSLNLAISTGVMLFHMGKRLPSVERTNP